MLKTLQNSIKQIQKHLTKSFSMQVTPLRYHDDNYCYMVKHTNDKMYKVVDPGDTEKILKFLSKNSILVDSILITHKHWDHIGDIDQFCYQLSKIQKALGNNQDVKLYAGKKDLVSGTTEELGVNGPEDKFTFENFEMTCLQSPCHTRGHTLFY